MDEPVPKGKGNGRAGSLTTRLGAVPSETSAYSTSLESSHRAEAHSLMVRFTRRLSAALPPTTTAADRMVRLTNSVLTYLLRRRARFLLAFRGDGGGNPHFFFEKTVESANACTMRKRWSQFLLADAKTVDQVLTCPLRRRLKSRLVPGRSGGLRLLAGRSTGD